MATSSSRPITAGSLSRHAGGRKSVPTATSTISMVRSHVFPDESCANWATPPLPAGVPRLPFASGRPTGVFYQLNSSRVESQLLESALPFPWPCKGLDGPYNLTCLGRVAPFQKALLGSLCGCSSVGRAQRCQRCCRGFESHHPLLLLRLWADRIVYGIRIRVAPVAGLDASKPFFFIGMESEV